MKNNKKSINMDAPFGDFMKIIGKIQIKFSPYIALIPGIGPSLACALIVTGEIYTGESSIFDDAGRRGRKGIKIVFETYYMRHAFEHTKNLQELCDTLNKLSDEEKDNVEPSYLNKFGQQPDKDSIDFCVYSWDDKNVLIRNVGQNFCIKPRQDDGLQYREEKKETLPEFRNINEVVYFLNQLDVDERMKYKPSDLPNFGVEPSTNYERNSAFSLDESRMVIRDEMTGKFIIESRLVYSTEKQRLMERQGPDK